MKLSEIAIIIVVGIFWIASLIMIMAGVYTFNIFFTILGLVFLIVTSYILKGIYEKDKMRTENLKITKDKEIELKEKELEHLNREIEKTRKMSMNLEKLDKRINEMSKALEELSKNVGRKRYECSVCGTVFFTDESENLRCPKCGSELIATRIEKLGAAFEKWCASGYEEEKGIFRTRDGWHCERGPLSETEFRKRFFGEVLPEKGLPDFQFSYQHPLKKWRARFQIECKWRSYFKNEKLEINDLKKYEEYDNKEYGRVFFVIGLLGSPLKPKNIFLIPYDKISEKERTRGYVLEKTLENYGKKRYPGQILNVTKNGDDVEMYWIKRPESKAR